MWAEEQKNPFLTVLQPISLVLLATMQRKTSGEADRELVCTAALCFAEINNLGIFYSNLNFNERYGTITLFQAALSSPRMVDTGHWFPEMQKDGRWMDV